MKTIRYYLAPVFFIFTALSFAQTEEEMLVDDMLLIAEEFALPAAEGVGYQSSAGWFTSARSMNEWQVEISVHANALFVPNSKQFSTISNSDFDILNIRGASSARVPTAFGGETDDYYEGEIYSTPFEFEALAGVNKEILVHPFVQATLGLPYGTDLAVRLLPKTQIDGVSFGTYGAGLKHNFSQYFRFNEPEDFQFAALVAYTKFDVAYEFAPVNIEIAVLDEIEVDADLWFAEVIGSKRYENFEVFGAFGITNSDFNYMMGGEGPALDLINDSLVNLNNGSAQFKGDLGFNLYFGNFKWSTMATAGRFFNLNLGLHYRI